ncbi:uncharacterized protein NPIL_581211 [Nephila pilipes]|uniref:Uncharacterized protein n=1 Tax=Nephila pilipes TaxID=299642 RepID=A0A8X6N477_NEPPI|nr:uncharacterized protein NPIL_581211 [Nephila pilipes]
MEAMKIGSTLGGIKAMTVASMDPKLCVGTCDFKKVIYDNNLPNADKIADTIAEVASRPIDQNLKAIPRDIMVRIYANIAANYIQSIGKLTPKNAEKLAKKYAKDTMKASKKYVKKCMSSVEPKFEAIAEGLVNFVLSLKKLVPDLSWKTGFLFATEFPLAAIQVGGSNDIYDKCSKEVEEKK